MNEKQALAEYNKLLRLIKRVMGNGSTYSSDLNGLGKKVLGQSFAGVYPADRIPTLGKKQKYAIVNLDDSDEPGSHWVACAYDNGAVQLYDSFGRNAKQILPSLTANHRVNNTDSDAEQDDTEENCGQRSLAWLILHALKGSDIADMV